MNSGSILDPYIDDITQLFADNYTYDMVLDWLADRDIIISRYGLVYWCTTREVRNRVQRGRHNSPVCANCENCLHFERANDERDILICKVTNKAVAFLVKTSPIWCPKREI